MEEACYKRLFKTHWSCRKTEEHEERCTPRKHLDFDW
jgi:hypothetical protein